MRHIKRCPKIVDRKKQVQKNRTCRHCGATFVRKSNCDRHIQKQHPNENETPHQDGNDDLIIDDFEMIPTQTIDLDPMMELRVENSVETQGDFKEPEEQIDQLAEDRNDDDIIDENNQETVEVDSLNQNDLKHVIIELDNLYQKRQAQFQDTFLIKIFRKVTADIKDNQKRNEALGFLVDVAGDKLNDKCFMQFLSENVGYKYTSQRLANILSGHKVQKKWKPRHSLSPETHKAICEFWLQQENATVSNDCRSNRDDVRISKLEYLQDYAHCTNINDKNITEKDVVLRKTGTKKK